MPTLFSERSRKRIANVVRTVEGMSSQERLQRRDALFHHHPVTCIATEDIDLHERGDVVRAKVSDLDNPDFEETGREFKDVFNFAGPVWDGSVCLVQSVILAGQGRVKSIFQTNSARRIHGKSTGQISPGTSGTIDAIYGVDGFYPLDETSVYLPTEFVTVDAERVVWAEWNSGNARFEVYSADCDGGA